MWQAKSANLLRWVFSGSLKDPQSAIYVCVDLQAKKLRSLPCCEWPVGWVIEVACVRGHHGPLRAPSPYPRLNVEAMDCSLINKFNKFVSSLPINYSYFSTVVVWWLSQASQSLSISPCESKPVFQNSICPYVIYLIVPLKHLCPVISIGKNSQRVFAHRH